MMEGGQDAHPPRQAGSLSYVRFGLAPVPDSIAGVREDAE